MVAATWRHIAEVLARRLAHHAFCDSHPESQPDADCPFCKDRAAYRLWQRKAGVRDVPLPEGRDVTLAELREREG